MSRSQRLARTAPMRKLLLEFAVLCDDMAKTARDAAEQYAWARPASYDRTVGDEAKVKQTGPSDTVSSIVIGKNGMRGQLRKAIEKMTEGVSRMSEARDLLEGALERTDQHRPEPSRTRPFPKTVHPDDLARLQDAKARREARGEGWGEG